MNDRTKFGLIIASLVLLLFFAFLALVFWSSFASGDTSQMSGVAVAMWIVIILAAFFIIAIILTMIISAVTWGQWLGDFREEGRDERGSRRSSREEKARTALEILDRRYAKGEITRDEYARMKEDLERTRPRL